MSNNAITWAWSMMLSGTRKLVLLALADHADDEGRCWPSLSRLQQMTGLSKSSVARALNELELEQIIVRDRSPGGRSSLYTLQLDPIKKGRSTVPERDGPRERLSQADNKTVPHRHTDSTSVGHEPLRTTKNHQKKKCAKFSPPSPEEVSRYCIEAGLKNIDPQAFCDFYLSKGWRVGNSAMKDWHAAARNWSRRAGENQKAKPTTAQQRDAAAVLQEQQL